MTLSAPEFNAFVLFFELCQVIDDQVASIESMSFDKFVNFNRGQEKTETKVDFLSRQYGTVR